jgi:flagellar M-ring protein FliF
VVSLGYLFRHGADGPDAFLFGGAPLSDGQLTRVEAAIAQGGLSGYVREGNRIRVPAGQQASYLAAVADGGALPPNFNTILEDSLDKGGPWESNEARRQRIKVANQRTLSEIVRAMNWVDDAVVLYDEQDERVPGRLSHEKKVTASISVKPIVGEMLTPLRANNLQKFVAAAVNMNSKDVNVTSLIDGGAFGGDGADSLGLLEDEYLKTKVAYEMQKRDSILNALRDIPGVRVEVNADLDDTVEEKMRNTKPDKLTSAPAHTISVTEDSQQSTTKGGGQPGPVSQGPTRQAPTTAAQQNENKANTQTEETTYQVAVEETAVLKKGYTPKVVWATVTIPSSYIAELWKQRNPTATAPPKPEDLTAMQGDVVPKVENIVEPLLKVQANIGENNYKHVTVVVVDSLAAPSIEPPSVAVNAMSWVSRYWTTLGMLGVAMFSLLVLRSTIKAAPSNPTPISAAGPALTLHADEPAAAVVRENEGEPPADDNRPRLRLKKGNSLKDDLVQVVKEDPGAAADILRSWIGKAS